MSPTYINSMGTYAEFISQFEIYPTQSAAQKKGYEAHHIIPRAMQTEPDDRCVRLTAFQHIYAHYLLALENEDAARIFECMVSFNEHKVSDLEKVTLSQLEEWGRLREEGRLSGENHPKYGTHHTEEEKQNLSKKLKIIKSNKQEREAQSNKLKVYYSKEENRQWCSDRQKKLWENEDYRQNVSSKMKEVWSDEDYRNSMSQKRKDVWTEERRQEWSVRQKQVWSSEEVRQKASDCAKKFWDNPESHKQMSEKHTGLIVWNNGVINKRSRECPGPEWVRGFVKRA